LEIGNLNSLEIGKFKFFGNRKFKFFGNWTFNISPAVQYGKLGRFFCTSSSAK